ncbi:MAG: hypothetical protein JO354_11490 [Verrucomicrobia bacterium]|nr:hypothetical protein [Verrucomicrobiota bacterium]
MSNVAAHPTVQAITTPPVKSKTTADRDVISFEAPDNHPHVARNEHIPTYADNTKISRFKGVSLGLRATKKIAAPNKQNNVLSATKPAIAMNIVALDQHVNDGYGKVNEVVWYILPPKGKVDRE